MLAAALFCAFTCAAAAASDEGAIRATLSVHTDKPLAVIDPDIYGQFAEHLGHGIYGGLWVGEKSPIANTRGFRNDVVAALKALAVPVIRWPGGCFADQYHWRDGVGPRAKRPVRVNVTWGGVAEPNEVGTHEFLDLTEMLGAKAYVDTNVGTGSPQETKDWLEYMTSPTKSSLADERRKNGRAAPWHVDYVGFGNEPWGCGGHMRPEAYSDLYHRFVTFANVPPGTKKIAAGGYDNAVEWTEALMAGNKFDDLDAITLHHYALPTGDWKHKGPATGFGEVQWIASMRAALQMDALIAAHSAVMDRYDPEKKVALDVDEWGNWYDPEPGSNPGFLEQQNTLRDGLTAALNFNIFHAHADRVRMANIAQMVNVLQALVMTDGPRMVRTPTYYAFLMYKPFRGATALGIETNSPQYTYGGVSVPAVQASAALSTSGALLIGLVNLDPQHLAHLDVALAPFSPKTVSGMVLTADKMDARNSFDRPDAVVPEPFHGASIAPEGIGVDLPAKSVVVLTVQ